MDMISVRNEACLKQHLNGGFFVRSIGARIMHLQGHLTIDQHIASAGFAHLAEGNSGVGVMRRW
jgi:hypothetical protein